MSTDLEPAGVARRRRYRPGAPHGGSAIGVEMRRAAVSAALLEGQSYRRIAATHGVALATVQRDLVAIRKQWKERFTASYEQHVTEAIAVLDIARAKVLTAVLDGDLEAVRVLIRLEDRRARLLGLDRPTQYEVTGVIDIEDPEAKRARALAIVDDQLAALRSAKANASPGEIVATGE